MNSEIDAYIYPGGACDGETRVRLSEAEAAFLITGRN